MERGVAWGEDTPTLIPTPYALCCGKAEPATQGEVARLFVLEPH